MRFFQNSIYAIIVAVFSLVEISSSFAAEGITELKTSSGLLHTIKALGSECGANATFATECAALFLNDKFILADQYVTISQAFPSKSNPQLVSIETATGGNACCWESYIFDFTVNPPLKFKGSLTTKNKIEVSRSAAGAIFPMYQENDALGDIVVGVYNYKFGSGHPVKIRETREYNITPLKDKKYPYEIMDDPVARAPILKLVGSKFTDFRRTVASPFKRIDGNFIVAEGCQPHNCNSRFTMFILDAANELAWAVEGTAEGGNIPPRARIWGLLTPNDKVPMNEITQWLARHNILQGRVTFMPLPDEVSGLFKKPRQLAANNEPSSNASKPKTNTVESSSLPLAPQIQSAQEATIQLEKEGGTLIVPVVINGELTLNFTVDSGAADVSVPADVVLTLVRTGTLNDDDFLGTKTYRLADGSTVPSQTFRIRSLKVGDHVLKDVKGSVAPVAGMLLLGQSFLSRFKSWSIDNQRRVLLLDQ